MPDHFTRPDDALALRMENDLLTMEVDHLRGQVVAFKQRATKAEASVASASAADATSAEVAGLRRDLARAERHYATEKDRVAELAQARSDLRWLLGRLGSSPAGALLRRFSGFRELEDRWLAS